MTTKKFNLEQYKLEDAQDWHKAYFNNEFYEDCFLPYYWKNPFVNFYHASGKAGSDDFCYAELEYIEPHHGGSTYISFETYADNLEGKKITNEDEYHDAVDLKHRILDIDCYNWRENPCWLTKNYPKILDTNPEHIMDKLYELIKIPKNKWPKEVIFNSKERLKESYALRKKYNNENEIGIEEFNFFDMIKSFYAEGEPVLE